MTELSAVPNLIFGEGGKFGPSWDPSPVAFPILPELPCGSPLACPTVNFLKVGWRQPSIFQSNFSGRRNERSIFIRNPPSLEELGLYPSVNETATGETTTIQPQTEPLYAERFS